MEFQHCKSGTIMHKEVALETLGKVSCIVLHFILIHTAFTCTRIALSLLTTNDGTINKESV